MCVCVCSFFVQTMLTELPSPGAIGSESRRWRAGYVRGFGGRALPVYLYLYILRFPTWVRSNGVCSVWLPYTTVYLYTHL